MGEPHSKNAQHFIKTVGYPTFNYSTRREKIEKNEAEGSISLNSLREAGNALDMKLVYGFIPKEGSLEQMIEIRARELAQKIVMRTSTTMILEDQENSHQRIKEAIVDMTEDLKKKCPGRYGIRLPKI
ncbi:helix-turn-helix domain-containing protein [Niabella hibiscisoli]|uniref:hypothetical protein n=1 Tax=Niabella hibiscisoli TaxID=1825928 RepID=UPI001F0F193B|nr:hypothetical protein [Niabella hibiscisoli]MCH5716217.1 hypothetical protein [Niabella hibiscisoli]